MRRVLSTPSPVLGAEQPVGRFGHAYATGSRPPRRLTRDGRRPSFPRPQPAAAPGGRQVNDAVHASLASVPPRARRETGWRKLVLPGVRAPTGSKVNSPDPERRDSSIREFSRRGRVQGLHGGQRLPPYGWAAGPVKRLEAPGAPIQWAAPRGCPPGTPLARRSYSPSNLSTSAACRAPPNNRSRRADHAARQQPLRARVRPRVGLTRRTGGLVRVPPRLVRFGWRSRGSAAGHTLSDVVIPVGVAAPGGHAPPVKQRRLERAPSALSFGPRSRERTCVGGVPAGASRRWLVCAASPAAAPTPRPQWRHSGPGPPSSPSADARARDDLVAPGSPPLLSARGGRRASRAPRGCPPPRTNEPCRPPRQKGIPCSTMSRPPITTPSSATSPPTTAERTPTPCGGGSRTSGLRSATRCSGGPALAGPAAADDPDEDRLFQERLATAALKVLKRDGCCESRTEGGKKQYRVTRALPATQAAEGPGTTPGRPMPSRFPPRRLPRGRGMSLPVMKPRRPRPRPTRPRPPRPPAVPSSIWRSRTSSGTPGPISSRGCPRSSGPPSSRT